MGTDIIILVLSIVMETQVYSPFILFFVVFHNVYCIHSFILGCRLECFRALQILLPESICLVSFDFSGCGNSGGQYITLGMDEQFELEFVIEYIRREFYFKKIGFLILFIHLPSLFSYA